MNVVYRLTNTINGKMYIGQTMKGIEYRMVGHKTGNPHSTIGKAIRKHGWDNFEYEVIDIGKSREQLLSLEDHYIREYNTLKPNGYNAMLSHCVYTMEQEMNDLWDELKE